MIELILVQSRLPIMPVSRHAIARQKYQHRRGEARTESQVVVGVLSLPSHKEASGSAVMLWHVTALTRSVMHSIAPACTQIRRHANHACVVPDRQTQDST